MQGSRTNSSRSSRSGHSLDRHLPAVTESATVGAAEDVRFSPSFQKPSQSLSSRFHPIRDSSSYGAPIEEAARLWKASTRYRSLEVPRRGVQGSHGQSHPDSDPLRRELANHVSSPEFPLTIGTTSGDTSSKHLDTVRNRIRLWDLDCMSLDGCCCMLGGLLLLEGKTCSRETSGLNRGKGIAACLD